METKLELMSGRHMAAIQAAAHNDAVFILSSSPTDTEKLSESMGLPEGYEIIRDVIRSFWNPQEEIRVCQLLSLASKKNLYRLSGFFADWLSLFDDKIAVGHTLREIYEKHVAFFRNTAAGCHDVLTNDMSILREDRVILNNRDWTEDRVVHLAYRMIDTFGPFEFGGQDLYFILQDSLDIIGRRIYPMAEMTDKFMSLLLKHFPEPPPLP